MFADRDVYTCFPDNDEQPKLIDLLDELGYPVDRTVKTYRTHWSFEAAAHRPGRREFGGPPGL